MMERQEVGRLFQQHYAKMYRVARTILYDEQESKDAVSSVFETLLHGRIALMPETEEQYLLKGVRNQCLKHLQHEIVKQRMMNRQSAEQSADSFYEDECLTDIVEFAVSRLSAQEQRIFNLRFSDGYSYEEIAKCENISKVAVWKHLSHILGVIKNHFNKAKDESH